MRDRDRRLVILDSVNSGNAKIHDSCFPDEFDLEGAILAWQCFRRMGLMLGEDPKRLARDLFDGITLGRYLRTDPRYQRKSE